MRQRGMFAYSGLMPGHVKVLLEKYDIYIVGLGRVNVAGMTTANMKYLSQAIAEAVVELLDLLSQLNVHSALLYQSCVTWDRG